MSEKNWYSLIYRKGFEHIELPAKLPDYFLRSNKSNINQTELNTVSYNFFEFSKKWNVWQHNNKNKQKRNRRFGRSGLFQLTRLAAPVLARRRDVLARHQGYRRENRNGGKK